MDAFSLLMGKEVSDFMDSNQWQRTCRFEVVERGREAVPFAAVYLMYKCGHLWRGMMSASFCSIMPSCGLVSFDTWSLADMTACSKFFTSDGYVSRGFLIATMIENVGRNSIWVKICYER